MLIRWEIDTGRPLQAETVRLGLSCALDLASVTISVPCAEAPEDSMMEVMTVVYGMFSSCGRISGITRDPALACRPHLIHILFDSVLSARMAMSLKGWTVRGPAEIQLGPLDIVLRSVALSQTRMTTLAGYASRGSSVAMTSATKNAAALAKKATAYSVETSIADLKTFLGSAQLYDEVDPATMQYRGLSLGSVPAPPTVVAKEERVSLAVSAEVDPMDLVDPDTGYTRRQLFNCLNLAKGQACWCEICENNSDNYFDGDDGSDEHEHHRKRGCCVQ